MQPSSAAECILIVDDSPTTLEVLRRNLEAERYEVFTAPGVAEATKVLDEAKIDLVITDLKMPGASGLDLVRLVRDNFKDTEVIMITGYPSIEGAVQAVKDGAEEYLPKPFTDEELLSAVKHALEKLRTRRDEWAADFRKRSKVHGLIGESEAMQEVYNAISKAGSSPATVLITGESGTGKELTARAIHYSSPRSLAPFVPVNCRGIPENLLENELFGHTKGAFTGATESRPGYFHAADGGAIFLHGVSETNSSTQTKLLRVLQNKEIYMAGSNQTQHVDVRILAATNRDLLTLAKKGAFREDLFYQLNVITITVPPLRKRGNDVLLLARHFADKFAEELGKRPPSFSDQALEVLRDHDWPGNVRELENMIQRAVVMTDTDSVDISDLPLPMRFTAIRDKELTRNLEEVETEYIRNVVASVSGNRSQAAKILGIDRKTLRQKLKKFETPSE